MKNPRSGFTLVELMVSLLIVIVVAVGWFRIMNMTAPYKEAQRRAAIEMAAGILDVFYPNSKDGIKGPGYYRYCDEGYPFSKVDDGARQRFPTNCFPRESTICYSLQLCEGNSEKWKKLIEDVEKMGELESGHKAYVARIELFDSEFSDEPFGVFEQLLSIAYTPRGIKGFENEDEGSGNDGN